ncbi:MAG: DNA-binding response OmpR family regulator [Thalassolituus oleivorans]|jgi:DNA-binding response OmpR family regulator
MSHTILIVEDDRTLRQGLERSLLKEGYRVLTAISPEEGLARFEENSVDLIVLDWMLPGRSGLEFCRDLRAGWFRRPIIMLTALSDESDKILGLDLGADDYLTKPFALGELLARIRAGLRRIEPQDDGPPHIVFGSAEVDFLRFEAVKDGAGVHLPARAFALLRKLVQEEGHVMTRDELMDEVWGYDVVPGTQTVDNHVSMLRTALEDNPRKPQFIRTVHGVGYRFLRDQTKP